MRAPLAPAEAWTAVRDSRFLARLVPVTERAGMPAVLSERAATHPGATHHCWALRVWRGGAIESAGSDAGEPAGTAGRPILGALERAGVVQAACVVSRWFGGTRLGTGGLTRAYAAAALAAVRAAAEADALPAVAPAAAFELRFDYAHTGAVERVAARYSARRGDAAYGAETRLVLSVPAGRADAFAGELLDATAGAVALDRRADRLEPSGGGPTP